MLRSANLSPAWYSGPKKDVQLKPGHDREIICMAVQGDKVVTGGSDHSLREYDLKGGRMIRELFTQRYGHSEWVTSCDYTPEGRILSGGMDSQLCLWDSRITRCESLLSHKSSISKVKVDEKNIGMASSYDGTISIWDLKQHDCIQTLGSAKSKSPLMDFDWVNSLAVTGSRDGQLGVWDINKGKCIKTARAHQGPISKVSLYSDSVNQHLIMSCGIEDGVLCLHDMRTHDLIFCEQLHGGAINFMAPTLSNYIVTASADKTLKVTDVLKMETLHELQTTDAVFCGEIVDNLAVAGCGDGNILVFDLDTGECLYGYGGSEKGGVRCMKVAEDRKRLVAGGDDGFALALHFG